MNDIKYVDIPATHVPLAKKGPGQKRQEDSRKSLAQLEALDYNASAVA